MAEAFRREIDDPAYRAYLDGIDARETHQGYFSVDRRSRQARFVEGKIDRKSRTSFDADAYDLIMRDKERLLSWMNLCGSSSLTPPSGRGGTTPMCSRSVC